MAQRPLWAPWRMEYIEGPSDSGCIFCESDPPKGDPARLILHRGQHVFVLLNRYPYSPGHVMVSPYAHAADLEALSRDCRDELMQRISDSGRILNKTYGSDGLNIGANLGEAGGAGFADHVHFHVVPRWTGDTNFMTVVGELRVIPVHLERIYEELVPGFAEL